MSEYRYYEFRTIDTLLDEHVRDRLPDNFGRAEITASSFTTTYLRGDLPEDPAELLARGFDAFVHVDDWGARWLGLRYPRGALDEDELEPFSGGIVELIGAGEHTCLHFHLLPEDVGGEWIDGEGWLDALLPLRVAIGSGDLRSLYLAWLADVEWGGFEEEDTEPPAPPGLGTLDEVHRDFVQFMQLDADLLAAAAEGSAPRVPSAPTREATLAWLAAQPADDKDAWLLRVLDGDGAGVRWELERRLQDGLRRRPQAAPPRTVGELRARAEAIKAERTAGRQALTRETSLTVGLGEVDE